MRDDPAQTNTPIATGRKQQGYAGRRWQSWGNGLAPPRTRIKAPGRVFDKRNLWARCGRSTINLQMGGPPTSRPLNKKPEARVPQWRTGDPAHLMETANIAGH
jgi:hypothetical protein